MLQNPEKLARLLVRQLRYKVLRMNQRKIHRTHKLEVLDDRRSSGYRKNLVFVQIGPGSEFEKWFSETEPRNWDVLANWYSESPANFSLGEIVTKQRGTKTTAVHALLSRFPDFFDAYERILFIDDDIIFEHGDIDVIFDAASRNDLGLFQCALTADSGCFFDDLKKDRAEEVTPFNTVEIMMPGFSSESLRVVSSLFGESVSGWGLDLALGPILRRAGYKVGVVNTVKARHPGDVDESGGAFYAFLKSLGINQRDEMYRLMQRYGLELRICPL